MRQRVQPGVVCFRDMAVLQRMPARIVNGGGVQVDCGRIPPPRGVNNRFQRHC